MPTKRHLVITHIIHAAGGQSNSALSQNFMHLKSSARVHAAHRAMCPIKIHLGIGSYDRISVPPFIQLVTSLYLSRDHELSQSFHITPAVTASAAKALETLRDGYPFGTLYGQQRQLSGDTTAPSFRRGACHRIIATAGPLPPLSYRVKRLTCSWSMLPGLSNISLCRLPDIADLGAEITDC